MAYGIFKLSKDLKIILNPDAVKLCPGLFLLPEEYLRYIILVYDIVDSPYRKKPEQERRRIVLNKFFLDKVDPETHETVKKGILEYQSMIYDTRREQMEILKKKIYTLQQRLNDEDDTKQIKSITETIKYLRGEFDSIEKEINIDEELVELKGGNKLSFIEVWMKNQMQFNSLKG